MNILYKCEPVLNKPCNKSSCFIFGGPCSHTTNIAFARKPIEKVTLALPMSEDDFNDLAKEASDE